MLGTSLAVTHTETNVNIDKNNLWFILRIVLFFWFVCKWWQNK